MREIFENWRTALTLEKSKRRAKHPGLELRFVGRAEGPAKLKGNPQESWRSQAFGIFPDQTDARRGDAFILNVVCERAHGTRAIGSDRDKDRGVNPILLQHSADFARSRFKGGGELARAIERVVKIRD